MLTIPDQAQTRAEVARLLSIPESTLRDLIRRKEIETNTERRATAQGLRKTTVLQPAAIRLLAAALEKPIAESCEPCEPLPALPANPVESLPVESELLRSELRSEEGTPFTPTHPERGQQSPRRFFRLEIRVFPRDHHAFRVFRAIDHLRFSDLLPLIDRIVCQSARLILTLFLWPSWCDWLCEPQPARHAVPDPETHQSLSARPNRLVRRRNHA